MVSKLHIGTAAGRSYVEEQKLRDAAKRGDISQVARLIESGVSVNSVHSKVSRRNFVAYNRIELYYGTCRKKHGNMI